MDESLIINLESKAFQMKKKRDVESEEYKEEKKENQGGRHRERTPGHRLMKTSSCSCHNMAATVEA